MHEECLMSQLKWQNCTYGISLAESEEDCHQSPFTDLAISISQAITGFPTWSTEVSRGGKNSLYWNLLGPQLCNVRKDKSFPLCAVQEIRGAHYYCITRALRSASFWWSIIIFLKAPSNLINYWWVQLLIRHAPNLCTLWLMKIITREGP